MPVQSCQEGNRPGYRWGGRGKCYTYTPGDRAGRNEAKQKAIKQGIAAGETPAVRSVPAAKLNRTQALADKRIDEMEKPTAELIRPVLDRAAERAARQFSRRAIKLSETQQPTADWIAPDDVVDVDALVVELRRVLDPVALALAETVQTAIFEHAQPVVAAAPVRPPNLKFDVTNPYTGLVLSFSADQITYVAATTKADVRRVLSRAYTDGLSIPHTADQIRDSMIEANGARATLIARTELAGIVNGASVAAVQIVSGATGDAYSKIWLTAPGAHYPRHEDYEGLDGQEVPLNGTFEVGGAALAYPGDPAGPPEEVCNCFPAATRVWTPALRAALRRWHDGDLVTVRLADGDDLSGTPNHPVLRADGAWVALGELRDGDDLVSARLARDGSTAPYPDDPVAEIGEVYRLANVAGQAQRIVVSPGDLHGDMLADGEVDVVAVDGALLLDSEAASDEQVAEFGLALAYVARASSSGRLDAAVVRGPRWGRPDLVGAASGGVRGEHERSASALVEASHVESVRLGGGAPRQLQLVQPPGDDGAADAKRGGDRQDALALVVSTTQVVQVDRLPFHGWVYNLDTGAGWYTAESIVSANCRCTVIYGDGSEVSAEE